MGFSDLSANVKAIDRFRGNLELALNYLCAEDQEEELKEIKPYLIKGREGIIPMIETP
jgi:hypothetical protein